MSDCPHGDGAHWAGDAGDVVDSLDHRRPYQWGGPNEITPESTYDHFVAWLRIQGVIA